MRTIRIGGVVLSLTLIVSIGYALSNVPHRFQPNQLASASEVNANFQHLVDAVTALEVRVAELETALEKAKVPEGFTDTNGVVHTATEQAALTHAGAMAKCAAMGARICVAAEYKQAGLGTLKETDYFADDHLWWNGNASYNYTHTSSFDPPTKPDNNRYS